MYTSEYTYYQSGQSFFSQTSQRQKIPPVAARGPPGSPTNVLNSRRDRSTAPGREAFDPELHPLCPLRDCLFAKSLKMNSHVHDTILVRCLAPSQWSNSRVLKAAIHKPRPCVFSSGCTFVFSDVLFNSRKDGRVLVAVMCWFCNTHLNQLGFINHLRFINHLMFFCLV